VDFQANCASVTVKHASCAEFIAKFCTLPCSPPASPPV